MLSQRSINGKATAMTKHALPGAAAFLVVLLLITPQALPAQSFPARPVTIIVPTTAGGGTDIIARIIGDALSKQLGQAFVIENRPGAGLLVGTAAAANAAPDGYTLLAGLNGNMAVNPSLFSTLPYDPIRDFTPIAMLAAYPFLVVVNKDLPAKTIIELIELARSKPGQMNYASAGNGTGQHLSMELFKMMTRTNFTHVPYRGAQPAYADIISGQVSVFFDNISGALAQVQGGNVRALAVTAKERSPVVRELPTVSEAGVPGYEYQTWFGLWAPRKTPQPIVELLHAEARKALSNPTVRDRITAQAGEPAATALADIEPFVKAEIAKWAEVVKAAGLKVQ
jgi:tripartite-type tricarboxylate transporter receptor subunit TctC